MDRAIAASLKGDITWKVEEEGEEVDTLIGSDPPLHWEAWHRLKGLYRTAVDCDPPPARVTLEQITTERVDLYSYLPPPGANIPICVEPFPVYDSVPTKEDIELAVEKTTKSPLQGSF